MKFGNGVVEFVRKKVGERRGNDVTERGGERKTNLTVPLPQLLLPIFLLVIDYP